jgi:hypothetical protein
MGTINANSRKAPFAFQKGNRQNQKKRNTKQYFTNSSTCSQLASRQESIGKRSRNDRKECKGISWKRENMLMIFALDEVSKKRI